MVWMLFEPISRCRVVASFGVFLTASNDFAQYVSMYAIEGPDRRVPLPTTPSAGNSPPSLLPAAKILQHVCLFLCWKSYACRKIAETDQNPTLNQNAKRETNIILA